MTSRALLALAASCDETAKQARALARDITATSPRATLRPNELARNEASAKFRKARDILKAVPR